MQNISTERLKAAARKAYREKRLTAQADIMVDRRCVYRSEGGKVCAIGAALTDHTAREVSRLGLNTGADVYNLANALLVKFHDVEMASMIQTRHDNWANTGKQYNAENPLLEADREKARQAFLAIIDYPTTKRGA